MAMAISRSRCGFLEFMVLCWEGAFRFAVTHTGGGVLIVLVLLYKAVEEVVASLKREGRQSIEDHGHFGRGKFSLHVVPSVVGAPRPGPVYPYRAPCPEAVWARLRSNSGSKFSQFRP